MTRTALLVVFAMVMFTAGAVVVLSAKDLAEHVLGAVAIVGALAVVVANVNGKDHR